MVLWAWHKHVEYLKSNSKFYADDGLLQNINLVQLQLDLDYLLKVFKVVGLKANAKKTKYMIVKGAAAPKALNTLTYNNMDVKRRGGVATLTY